MAYLGLKAYVTEAMTALLLQRVDLAVAQVKLRLVGPVDVGAEG